MGMPMLFVQMTTHRGPSADLLSPVSVNGLYKSQQPVEE
jgi:hypothetical protein